MQEFCTVHSSICLIAYSFDVNIFALEEAVIGILEFIKENDKLFSTSFEKKSRFITKYINQIGGVKPISCFDRLFFKSELEKVSKTIAKL
jgi:hypothetical protein